MEHSIGGRPVQVGDLVRITRGPFAGLVGSFAGSSGQRVFVVIENRGRRLDLEMELAWVDATQPRRRSVSRVEGSEIQRRSNS